MNEGMRNIVKCSRKVWLENEKINGDFSNSSVHESVEAGVLYIKKCEEVQKWRVLAILGNSGMRREKGD